MALGRLHQGYEALYSNTDLSSQAAVAGASAAAAYLDAKYHIRKDLADLNDWRKIGKTAQRVGTLSSDSIHMMTRWTTNERVEQQSRTSSPYGISSRSKPNASATPNSSGTEHNLPNPKSPTPTKRPTTTAAGSLTSFSRMASALVN